MTSSPRPSATDLALAAGAALAVAIAAGAMFAYAAKPGDMDARLAAAAAKAEQARVRLRTRPSAPVLPAQAICSDPTATAARLRQALVSLATNSRLERPLIVVAPATSPGTAGLSVLTVRLEGEGPYDAVLAALAGLDQLRPLVFVDTADLSANTATVNLVVSGRAYCSVSV